MTPSINTEKLELGRANGISFPYKLYDGKKQPIKMIYVEEIATITNYINERFCNYRFLN